MHVGFINLQSLNLSVTEKDIVFLCEYILRKHQKTQHKVGIVIVTNQHIKKLNRQYRFQDRVTDVLSFPSNLEHSSWEGDHDLGDICIAPEYVACKHNADVDSDKLKIMYYKVVIHGLLHLLGYDHENAKDSSKMLQAEEEILEEYLSQTHRTHK